ncbi:MAG: hypothetical protein KGM43_18120, partial [Planctomycetota bacterium]|nr:hypothetical protein [Planctomycetota bacterium]
VTSVSILPPPPGSPPPSPTSPVTVVATLNHGHIIKGGYFFLTIDSGGIQDMAGNALDGEFYGDFPSGNGIPGGNFNARILAYHDLVLPLTPFYSSASPRGPVNISHTPTHYPKLPPPSGTMTMGQALKARTRAALAIRVAPPVTNTTSTALAAHDAALARFEAEVALFRRLKSSRIGNG